MNNFFTINCRRSVKALVSCLFFVVLILADNVFSQETTPVQMLSLQQVVAMAKDQSPAAKQAFTLRENRYWLYRTYKSNYKPQLGLNGTLPDFSRSIINVTQPDGTEAFKRRSLSSSSLDLSLSQNVGLTGGEVFVSSQLQRIDIFTEPAGTSYLANPAVIGFRQPLFMYNSLAWDKKIEPLKYEESKRQYLEDMEGVAFRASELFFDLLLAQINLDIARKNLKNNDTLYQISAGRFNLGKIAENDLLQMELSVMNARNNISQGALDVQLGTLRLKNFLTIKGDEKIILIEPGMIPEFEVDINKAMAEATKNRQQVVGFERLKLEAEREVAKAKGENRLNANLFASYGLTQSSQIVENAYLNPLEQERLRVGFQIPIVDWGRAKSQIRTSQANQELVEINITQAQQNFEQEILMLVTQFKMYREKLVIAMKSDTIAQKRYDITVQRYLIGKIGILDLNVALDEKIKAKRSYVQSLSDFWSAYYELRRKTLFDFEVGKEISY